MELLRAAATLESMVRQASIQMLESTKITLSPHRADIGLPMGKGAEALYQTGYLSTI